MKRDEILKILGVHRGELKGFGVKSLALFGSAARDELEPESDVDLLVEFKTSPGFDGYMNLKFYLEELLGCQVDLVMEKALKSWARPAVEREAIRVA